MEENIPKVMKSWFKSFLENRKAKVKVCNEEYSKWTKMEYSGFADDLYIWTSSEYVEKGERENGKGCWQNRILGKKRTT